MDFRSWIVQPLIGWWQWTVFTALGFDRTVLLAVLAACLLTAGIMAFQLKQLGFLGRSVVTVVVTCGLFALCLALSHVSPVFFDPEALAQSQVPR